MSRRRTGCSKVSYPRLAMVNSGAGGKSAQDCLDRCNTSPKNCRYWDWDGYVCRLRAGNAGQTGQTSTHYGGRKGCKLPTWHTVSLPKTVCSGLCSSSKEWYSGNSAKTYISKKTCIKYVGCKTLSVQSGYKCECNGTTGLQPPPPLDQHALTAPSLNGKSGALIASRPPCADLQRARRHAPPGKSRPALAHDEEVAKA